MKIILAISSIVLINLSGCSYQSTEIADSKISEDKNIQFGEVRQVKDSSEINPSGTILELLEPAFENNVSSLIAIENRTDIAWGSIYLKASIPNIHYNLNQEANEYDSLADDWSLIFHLYSPFNKGDTLFFCGPVSTFTITVYNYANDLLIYDSLIQEVKSC